MVTESGVQTSLFSAEPDAPAASGPEGDLDQLRAIGVTYEPDFLTREECDGLLRDIDARPEQWLTDLQRRVQHYGWKYDYSARGASAPADPVPEFIAPIAERLRERGWFGAVPDQVIVNEYEPGQGIAAHADRDCFGPAVAMLSLADRWPMQFIPPGGGDDRLELFLDVGSILVLTGEAREQWLHTIAKRKSDGRGPEKRQRERRVSVTFRTVNQ